MPSSAWDDRRSWSIPTGSTTLRERRRRRTDDPARGYYEDAYDFDGLRERVLLPLAPGGTRRFATRIHDLETDELISHEFATAPADAVVLFAASFLQRHDPDEFRVPASPDGDRGLGWCA